MISTKLYPFLKFPGREKDKRGEKSNLYVSQSCVVMYVTRMKVEDERSSNDGKAKCVPWKLLVGESKQAITY